MNAKHFGLISLIFLLINFYLFNKHGIKIVNDSARYLEYADNLSHGFYVDRHNIWYLGYAIFIFIVHSFFSGEFSIIIFQYILSFISVIALYKTYHLLFNNTTGALITSLLSVLFIEVTAWNSYILCESIYYSFTCFSIYLLAKLYLSNSYNYKKWIGSLSIILFTILIKPTGIALLGTLTFILITTLIKKIKSYFLKYTILTLGIVMLLLLANKMLTTYYIIENYTAGEVVHGIQQYSGPSYAPLIMKVPENIFIPSTENEPLMKIILFIINNPWYWLKLTSTKIFYFLIHIRPFWSWGHNLFCLVVLIPLYTFGLYGIFKNKLNSSFLNFPLLFIGLHSIIIGTTSVDWDGRFLMPVFPILFIIGINGFMTFFRKKVLLFS